MNRPIDLVLVIDKTSGLPLWYISFTPTEYGGIDPVLFSGFISAITSFSSEISSDFSGFLDITYGLRNVLVIPTQHLLMAVIYNREDVHSLIPQLYSLLNKLDAHYQLSQHSEIFDTFQKDILRLFSTHFLDLNWIPYRLRHEGKDLSPEELEVFNAVDGRSNPREVCRHCNLSEQDALYTLLNLQVKGYLSFVHVLSDSDFIVASPRILKFFKRHTDEYDALEEIFQQYPTCRDSIMESFRLLLKHPISAKQLRDIFTTDMEVFNELMVLLQEYNSLIILSKENRRLVITKTAVQSILNIALDFDQKRTLIAFANALAATRTRLIHAQVSVNPDKGIIRLDPSHLPSDIFTPSDILDIINAWVDLILDFFHFLKESLKHDKWIKLVKKISETILEVVDTVAGTSADYSALGSITSWLENNLA